MGVETLKVLNKKGTSVCHWKLGHGALGIWEQCEWWMGWGFGCLGWGEQLHSQIGESQSSTPGHGQHGIALMESLTLSTLNVFIGSEVCVPACYFSNQM